MGMKCKEMNHIAVEMCIKMGLFTVPDITISQYHLSIKDLIRIILNLTLMVCHKYL